MICNIISYVDLSACSPPPCFVYWNAVVMNSYLKRGMPSSIDFRPYFFSHRVNIRDPNLIFCGPNILRELRWHVLLTLDIFWKKWKRKKTPTRQGWKTLSLTTWRRGSFFRYKIIVAFRLRCANLRQRSLPNIVQMSMQKVRDNRNREDEKNATLTKRRMKSVIDLKKSISSTQENLQALQARDAARMKRQDATEKKERQQILQDGGNPDQVLLQRKNRKNIEKQKK